MKLIGLTLAPEYSYKDQEKNPLKGEAVFLMDNGSKFRLELTTTQSEPIAAAIAEMLTPGIKTLGGTLRNTKISVAKVENILEDHSNE